MKKACLLLFLVTVSRCMSAQELFPVAEPASNVPKGALGVRVFDRGYQEAGTFRNLTGIRLLYGVTPKLSVYATATLSDYHPKTLPFDFISHDHVGGQVVGGTNTPVKGIVYPFVFNSADFFAKYRFVSFDGPHTHFRMAAFGEGAKVFVPSHEAEPELLVHTSGYGGGLITTYLQQHFAASITTGFIVPSAYSGNATDKFGGVYPTTIRYGKAFNYSLSFGYLLFPRKYKNYSQTNLNLYLELVGKSYGSAQVSQKDGPAPEAVAIPMSGNTPMLNAGNYTDINPGIQCIINSTYRIDMSVAFPLLNSSYTHQYPMYMLGVQRYFYFSSGSLKKNDKL